MTLSAKKNLSDVSVLVLSLFLLESCSFREVKVQTAFNTQVTQILVDKCIQCHSGTNASGGLHYILDSNALIANGYITPSNASTSLLYQKLLNTPPYGERMPKGGPYLSDGELNDIATWINSQSALVDSDNDPEVDILGTTMSFSTDIVPILTTRLTNGTTTNQKSCIECHNTANTFGHANFNMGATSTSINHGLILSSSARAVIAGNFTDSWLCQKVKINRPVSITGARMPKNDATNPVKLTPDQVNKLCTWIQQGALNN